MPETLIDPERLTQLAARLPADGPIQVLNLLRFRERARYATGTAAADTGQDAYLRGYLPAFRQVVAELGMPDIQPVFAGSVLGTIVGPGHWHAAAVVAYPDFASFRRIVESTAYRELAEPHRLASLEELQLIALAPLPLS